MTKKTSSTPTPAPASAPAVTYGTTALVAAAQNPNRSFISLSSSEIENLKLLANLLVARQPASAYTAEDYLLLLIRGMELGLSPLMAADNLRIINNKLTVNPPALPAICAAATGDQFSLTLDTYSPQAVKVSIRRAGHDGYIFSREYTIAEAEQKHYTRRTVWQTNPAAMLYSHALINALRGAFPEVMFGLHLADELGDYVEAADPLGNITINPDSIVSATAHLSTETGKTWLRDLLTELNLTSRDQSAVVLAQLGIERFSEFPYSVAALETRIRQIHESINEPAKPKAAVPEPPSAPPQSQNGKTPPAQQPAQPPAEQPASTEQGGVIETDAVFYDGKYISFLVTDDVEVRHYGRNKLKTLVGEQYWDDNNIGHWEADKAYEIAPLRITWEWRGKPGNQYRLLIAAEPVNASATSTPPPDLEEELDDFFPPVDYEKMAEPQIP